MKGRTYVRDGHDRRYENEVDTILSIIDTDTVNVTRGREG